MQTALSEYLSDCDTLRQFSEENYVSVSLASTSLKDFTARYNEWCKQYHYPTSNGRVLANELRQAGWEVVIGHGNLKSIKGLGLSDG